MGTSLAAPSVLAMLLAVGCERATPGPIKEPPGDVIIPPTASGPPSFEPPAAVATPTASASVDRLNCRPHGPAVRFEVENDDLVRPIDASGCPLGESHFKGNGYAYKASVDFMTELQKRAKAGDKAGLAELANFPLRVNAAKGGVALVVKDRAAFLRQIDHIYTPAVVKAIVDADPRDLFCRDQGVMLGQGIVWADNKNGGHYGVIAVNPP